MPETKLESSDASPGNPFTPAMELFRMIDPPSFISGRAFYTVNRVPRTLTLNVSSKPFSVIEPSGLLALLHLRLQRGYRYDLSLFSPSRTVDRDQLGCRHHHVRR